MTYNYAQKKKVKLMNTEDSTSNELVCAICF